MTGNVCFSNWIGRTSFCRLLQSNCSSDGSTIVQAAFGNCVHMFKSSLVVKSSLRHDFFSHFSEVVQSIWHLKKNSCYQLVNKFKFFQLASRSHEETSAARKN